MQFNWKLLIDPTWWFLSQKNPPPPEEPVTPLEVPDTEIGKYIPVLFGTRPIVDPSLAWYGDVKIIKIKVSSKGKK